VDASLVDRRQLSVIDELGIEMEPLRIVVRESVPEFDDTHQFSVLIAAGQIGVGIAQTAAFPLQSEEGLDTGAGRAAGRDVVAIESRRITPVRDGKEVHREGVGRGKQYLS
jgi:hypothetical protein